ncbi:response regulator [Paenibacillus spongiae]|uniref:Response regulator n=1 Tax=Paenibacillus spongiae TaxID=2909671 RepID=A0ABY5S9W6_9BACL|nr:response regulator [Paenibacillus spongiae]UVI30449.1 response regulator [Paenibacillus spongiae]
MELKVFVVDDEERQRSSIIRHVDWKRYHMRVTGEAEDADQAIRLAELDPPDLLITDIRMLGMNGLELSSRMRGINSRMHIIMVTGFEEFEYAKSALDLGVDAFLVKPIIFDELTAILEQISHSEQVELTKRKEEELIKEQLNAFKPIARENLLQELIHGLILCEEAIGARARSLDMFARAGARRILIIVIDADPASPLPKEEQVNRLQPILRREAANALGSLLEETTTTQRGNIVLILQGATEASFDHEVEYSLQKLELGLGKTAYCSICIGAGPAVPTLARLSESFQLAQRAVNQRFLGGHERIFRWQVLGEQAVVSDKRPEELIGDFLEAMGAGDSQISLGLLGEMMRRIAGDIHIHGTELRSLCLQLVSGASRVAGEIGDSNRHLGSEKELWEQILDCREEQDLLQETVRIMTRFCNFVAERKKSHSQIIVQKALEFMNGHYKDNLSLRLVADSVYLSPNYLGALFRSELGVSFTDQLIQIRVNKAKELLHQSELKLYEVAERVGYQNIGYFTSLFKRITGLTPKEFRAYLGVVGQD